MQEYIGDHILEEITMTNLAEACAYSPWYARKLFIEVLGRTPAEYIRRLKLSKSALKLRDEDCRVLDLALEMGYGSVDGYQRAFRKEFGCNPKEYAQCKIPLWLFTPYLIDLKRERNGEEMSNIRNIFIQVKPQPVMEGISLVLRELIKNVYRGTGYRECQPSLWGSIGDISIRGEITTPERAASMATIFP